MRPAASEPLGWFVRRVEDARRILVINAEVALHAFMSFIPPTTLMQL